jgi:hypothetical protein
VHNPKCSFVLEEEENENEDKEQEEQEKIVMKILQKP